MAKEELIKARCTAEFKAQAKRAAKGSGRSLANFVLWAVQDHIEQVESGHSPAMAQRRVAHSTKQKAGLTRLNQK